MRQFDLFEIAGQPDILPEKRGPVVFRADPEKVRRKLQLLLDEIRAADVIPWTSERLDYHRLVFPQMSRWLPEEEAAKLCLEFEAEIRRLKAA